MPASSCVMKLLSKATVGVVCSLSSSSNTVQFEVVHQLHDLQHKQHTNFCKQHVQNLHVLVSLDLWNSWDFILDLGSSASDGSSSSSFSLTTSSRGASSGSMSSPIGRRSVFRVFVRLTSALLCHTRFPAAEKCSHCCVLWKLLCSNRR